MVVEGGQKRVYLPAWMKGGGGDRGDSGGEGLTESEGYDVSRRGESWKEEEQDQREKKEFGVLSCGVVCKFSAGLTRVNGTSRA